MREIESVVLVTGGAGFIGSHTVDLLLREGYRVRVLDDFSTGRRENLPQHPRLEVVAGSVEDPDVLRSSFREVVAVVHLAAQVSVQRSVEDPVQSCRQNILGFVGVLDAARKQSARVVYASSAAVYGDPETLPLSERATIQPISPYGLEKYGNELYAELFGRLHGLSQLGLRYFNVYGPRQDPNSPYSGVISRFIDQLRRGRALTVRGDGLQERDFIHVSDVARVNVAALRNRADGVVNVASGRVISIRRLAELMIELHGGTSDVEWVAPLPGDIRRSQADVRRMRQLLIEPLTPLERGLQTLIESGLGKRSATVLP